MMLALLKKHKISKITEDSAGEEGGLKDQFYDNSDAFQEKTTEKELQQCIQELKNQICVPGFPSKSTAASEVAEDVLKQIDDVME